MQALGSFLFINLFFIFYISSLSLALTKAGATRRQLTTLKQTDPQQDFECNVDPTLTFMNHRIKNAYCAFQEWKKVIFSDPHNMTGNWVGPDVCSYHGVLCTEAPDDMDIITVASLDINNGDIAGHLVPQLSLLSDVGILHIGSNRFCGIFPKSFSKFRFLFEIDAGNNRFVGPFPSVLLEMPNLRFLDIRYNEFEGALPPQLFDKILDGINVHNNHFSSTLPENMGNSPASLLILSHNKFTGCIPSSFGRMPHLEEVILANNNLSGCLPEEVGMLQAVRLFDVSNNMIMGPLPRSLERLKTVEKLDISGNRFTGKVSENICSLPGLWNFTFSHNYFHEIGVECEKRSKDGLVLGVEDNCLPEKLNQKPDKVCSPVVSRPVDCRNVGCRPRKLTSVEPGKRKVRPQRAKPSPPKLSHPPKPVQSSLPHVQSPPPPVQSPPPPLPPPAPVASPPPAPVQPPSTPVFTDLILPPNIGSRYSLPLPPVLEGY